MLAAIGASLVAWVAAFAIGLKRDLSGLPRWEEELKAYAARNRTNPPPANAVLFVGSSSIRLWDSIRQDFPRFRVFRRGLNGARLEDTLRLANELIFVHHPQMIILYGGDNDLAEGHTPARILRDYQDLVRRIRSELKDTPVGILSVKPSPSRWHLIRRVRETNRRLREWCESDDGLLYVDIYTGMINERGQPRQRLFQADGLHPSPAGYQKWADAIREFLPDSARRTNMAALEKRR